jgi:serine/threonine-protein kinase HipA
MHLKNFSLITRRGRVALAPGYDLLNSTIALKNPKEEMALPIHGKRSGLTRQDLFDYFAAERLQINERVLAERIEQFRAVAPMWNELIAASFLSQEKKAAYAAVLAERKDRLQL